MNSDSRARQGKAKRPWSGERRPAPNGCDNRRRAAKNNRFGVTAAPYDWRKAPQGGSSGERMRRPGTGTTGRLREGVHASPVKKNGLESYNLKGDFLSGNHFKILSGTAWSSAIANRLAREKSLSSACGYS
ncbi:hypothetical protein C4K11_3734 [Pseudomonas chlororaphis subsp. aureofaciens]|nr:hypothetical protein C4K11_3734 [Pseudomonas chlororaphis subsp. aureofaciens]